MPNIFHEEKEVKKIFKKSIYAYTTPSQDGYIKVGQTTKDPVKRISDQLIKSPNTQFNLLGVWDAAASKTHSELSDHMVHKVLENHGFERFSEFFKVEFDCLRSIMAQLETGVPVDEVTVSSKRYQSFEMRKEQREAVRQTIEAFGNGIPSFLWNAKMRFGKTFTSYKLIEQAGFKKILMITYKPSIIKGWVEDLRSHVDFEGWGYEAKVNGSGTSLKAHKGKPTLIFKSFQDIKGRKGNKIKDENISLYSENFDLIIFDEYHFGSWNENSKKEISKDLKKLNEYQAWLDDETNDVIKAKKKLYLSGTPFKVLASGEFSDDQVFTWSYNDEQRVKHLPGNKNNIQYQSLPTMAMLVYEAPIDITQQFKDAEGEEFSLNSFFKAEDKEFVNKNEVLKFMRWLAGGNTKDKSPKPFSHYQLAGYVDHSFWMLPSVSAVYAMHGLLTSGVISAFTDFEVIIAADSKNKSGSKAYDEVKKAISENKKTITLSAGMLNTGTTVKEWKAVFMLSDIKSPESYFQTAFRAQSPYYESKSGVYDIKKDICYVLDFAPARAYRMPYNLVKQYSNSHITKEARLQEIMDLLPVLAMDGSGMKELKAEDIMDLVVSGTTGSLLARKWESNALVNVSNEVISRILNDQKIIDTIMKIKGFRNLNKDFELIINRSEKIKKAKKKVSLTPKEVKTITKEQKELASKRKEIQEKLIKFAARIPIFMYLTDSREENLYDLITTLEPELFYQVTGLTTMDFELLNKVGLFNTETMDNAVWDFRRFENDSFEYAGISKRDDQVIGGYRGYISKEELLKKEK